MDKIVISFIIVLGCCLNAYALKCYSCTMTGDMNDQSCLTEPKAAGGQPIITCTKKYCTITRQEINDPPGKINSFLRGCEDEPLFLNTVVEDWTFKTYYRSCTSDLCNDGDGVRDGGLSVSSDGMAGENLLVPGCSSASNVSPRTVTYALALMLAAVCARLLHQE